MSNFVINSFANYFYLTQYKFTAHRAVINLLNLCSLDALLLWFTFDIAGVVFVFSFIFGAVVVVDVFTCVTSSVCVVVFVLFCSVLFIRSCIFISVLLSSVCTTSVDKFTSTVVVTGLVIFDVDVMITGSFVTVVGWFVMSVIWLVVCIGFGVVMERGIFLVWFGYFLLSHRRVATDYDKSTI